MASPMCSLSTLPRARSRGSAAAPGGVQANGASAAPSANADGTFVAFDVGRDQSRPGRYQRRVGRVRVRGGAALPASRQRDHPGRARPTAPASIRRSAGRALRVVYATEATNLGREAAGTPSDGRDAGRPAKVRVAEIVPADADSQRRHPDRGPVDGGQSVTLTGTGWTSNMTLTFAGREATITASSATER